MFGRHDWYHSLTDTDNDVFQYGFERCFKCDWFRSYMIIHLGNRKEYSKPYWDYVFHSVVRHRGSKNERPGPCRWWNGGHNWLVTKSNIENTILYFTNEEECERCGWSRHVIHMPLLRKTFKEKSYWK